MAFILSEPNIQFERKEQVIRDLLQEKVQTDALGLALLMVERQHVEGVKAVRDEFERLYDNYRGQAHAEITTATPLDDDLREQVKADLQRVTGKRIILHERVDPTILGGAIARVGDTLIDGSVRRKLSLLRQQILRGGGLGGAEDGALPDTGTPPGGAPTTDTPSVDDGSMMNEMGPHAGGSAHVAPRDGDSTAKRERNARGRDKRDRRRRR